MCVSTNERNWFHHYEQLKKYKNIYGNCNVPRRHGVLGNWVSTQRRRYKLLKEGKSSAMSDDCVRKLESIGFVGLVSGNIHQIRNQVRICCNGV